MYKKILLFTASLLFTNACSKEQELSVTHDIVSRKANVIYYRSISAGGDYIARRYCPKKMLTPTRDCPVYDSEVKENLSYSLVSVASFQKSFLSRRIESEKIPEGFEGENGLKRLDLEIESIEKFLQRPNLTTEEIDSGKAQLSLLEKFRQGHRDFNRLLEQVSKGLNDLPDFSQDFATTETTFNSSAGRYIYDRGNDLWWVSLGERDFWEASGQTRPAHAYISPIGSGRGQVVNKATFSSCQQQFGANYRLPSVQEYAQQTFVKGGFKAGWFSDGRPASQWVYEAHASDLDKMIRRWTYCVVNAR